MSDEPVQSSGEGGEGGEEPTMLEAFIEQVMTLVVAIAIALMVRQVLIEPFRIPSGSMFPTLLVGDHLFVNKISYGPRVPFTDFRLPGLREPERGDIVVFEIARPARPGMRDIMPVDQAPPGSHTEDFVKRVVGLPGDVVAWSPGRLSVNDEPVALTAAGIWTDDRGQAHVRGTEDLGACRHSVLHNPAIRNRIAVQSTLPPSGVVKVPQGRYFMMGDNRDGSNDSRAWGTVRFEEMKGPAFMLYWSWAHEGNMLAFFNPLVWFTAEKRWDRVFQGLDCDPVPGVTSG
ncbi:MAG: signal peptidase I [Deltaproteobacteria bacterium]|nr:signal peptidase I [Deltaproteobacteria bacterium]